MMEEGIHKILRELPDTVISLFWALIITGAGYLFIYFAKFMRTLPRSFDLPWILIFFCMFFIVLVRKRIRIMRQERKPPLMGNK